MQLQVENYITLPQSKNILPSRAAVFFDLTNQFNSVSREAFFNSLTAIDAHERQRLTSFVVL